MKYLNLLSFPRWSVGMPGFRWVSFRSTHPTILLLLFSMQNVMADSTWFITKWQTTAANESITIPKNSSYSYNYDIDCDNDSTFEQLGVTGDGTCTYATAGEHLINIQGTFPAIYINNGSMKTKILDVVQWGTIIWKSMHKAFYGASNLQITATDSPDLSNVTDMYYMFLGTTAFNSDIGSWDVSNVTNMYYMFSDATAFNSELSSWDVSNVTNMSRMFAGATTFNSDISSWDVSNVTDMSGMFIIATTFNSDLSRWNVNNVTNMSGMFYGASAFNQDLSSWNVSNVTDMFIMFYGASAFNQDLSSWNVSNVTNMSSMFSGASAFNQDISSWNVSNVTDMSSMFSGATAFNQDLSSWNVSNVTNMSSMFGGADAFNQNLSSWNVSNVTDMSYMFINLHIFNQDISIWDVSNVTDMSYMFGYTAFNQDISGWDVSNVTDMTDMFLGITLSTANYDALLVGWDSLPLQSGVSFGGGNSVCTSGSSAEAARTNMISTDGWIISDGGCKTAQIITFPNPGKKTLGETLTLAAISDSGLSVSYTSTTPSVCTVDSSSGTVTLVSAGQCSITASQAGDATYAAATDVSQSFMIISPPPPIPSYKLTLEKTIGGTITGEGINCGSDCQQYFDRGTKVPLTAIPANTWVFKNWTGDCDSDGIVIIKNDSTCSATFAKQYTLNLTTEGQGTIDDCGTECTQTYLDNETVQLSTTSAEGWQFSNWTGDCDENGAITLNSNKSCTANFVNEHTLTLTTNGQGTIENCGTQCTQTHPNGKMLQLSATPADGWQFSDWTGACDNEGNVTMSSDKACQANFMQIVTLTVTLIGNGTVTGKDINCGDSCTTDYPINTSVALVAEPEMEWIFNQFSGSCDSQGNVQMTSDKTCIATFIADPNIPNHGDANNDGIPDSQQNHVVTIPDQVDGEYLTLEVEPTCSIDDAYTDLPDTQGKYDRSYQFPQGTMYFELGCAETDVIVYFHALRRAQNPILQKYGPTTPGDLTTLSWYTIPNVTYGLVMIDTQPVVTATYHLIDGELGDNTGIDGRIIDPMGLVCNTAWNASYTR